MGHKLATWDPRANVHLNQKSHFVLVWYLQNPPILMVSYNILKYSEMLAYFHQIFGSSSIPLFN